MAGGGVPIIVNTMPQYFAASSRWINQEMEASPSRSIQGCIDRSKVVSMAPLIDGCIYMKFWPSNGWQPWHCAGDSSHQSPIDHRQKCIQVQLATKNEPTHILLGEVPLSTSMRSTEAEPRCPSLPSIQAVHWLLCRALPLDPTEPPDPRPVSFSACGEHCIKQFPWKSNCKWHER